MNQNHYQFLDRSEYQDIDQPIKSHNLGWNIPPSVRSFHRDSDGRNQNSKNGGEWIWNLE